MLDISKRRIKLLILRCSSAIGLFHLTRLLARRKLLILCYHGFELRDEAHFRPQLFMQRDVFSRRLAAIRRSGCPVLALDEAVQHLKDGTLPNNSVCLTIDDGFFSVLEHAAPVLQQHGYPATLYVTSYYVAKEAPVFRLVIQYMFWKTKIEQLDVTDQPWGPNHPVTLQLPEERDLVAWRIIQFGESGCDEPARQQISRLLGERLHVEYSSLFEARLVTLLTREELKQLSDYGIDVQLHTHRHQLPFDDEAAVRSEVGENAAFLQNVLGRPLTHFCYPSGEWDRRQWPWLDELGVQSATTCNPGLNTAATPLLGLYRMVDSNDISQIEFTAELYGFSELVRQLMGRRRTSDRARQPRSETAAD